MRQGFPAQAQRRERGAFSRAQAGLPVSCDAKMRPVPLGHKLQRVGWGRGAFSRCTVRGLGVKPAKTPPVPVSRSLRLPCFLRNLTRGSGCDNMNRLSAGSAWPVRRREAPCICVAPCQPAGKVLDCPDRKQRRRHRPRHGLRGGRAFVLGKAVSPLAGGLCCSRGRPLSARRRCLFGPQ